MMENGRKIIEQKLGPSNPCLRFSSVLILQVLRTFHNSFHLFVSRTFITNKSQDVELTNTNENDIRVEMEKREKKSTKDSKKRLFQHFLGKKKDKKREK